MGPPKGPRFVYTTMCSCMPGAAALDCLRELLERNNSLLCCMPSGMVDGHSGANKFYPGPARLMSHRWPP